MNYVIVTGAAGGMGKSTALNLSKSGFKVFALDYNDLDYSDGRDRKPEYSHEGYVVVSRYT